MLPTIRTFKEQCVSLLQVYIVLHHTTLFNTCTCLTFVHNESNYNKPSTKYTLFIKKYYLKYKTITQKQNTIL